jgi:hypothetical protein
MSCERANSIIERRRTGDVGDQQTVSIMPLCLPALSDWETFAERRVRLFSAIPSSVDPFVTMSDSHFICEQFHQRRKGLALVQLKFGHKNLF